MNNKVLIFWLWFQWKKYIDFFKNKWYILDWVSKSWLNKNKNIWLNQIFSFEYIINNKDFDIKQYDYIIVAVSSDNEQDNVIKFLLKKEVLNNVIIEKPVSYNLKILQSLIYKDNYFFFIDEIVLNRLYYKLFNANQILTIKIYEDNLLYSTHILEHIFWWFILFDNFKDILTNKKIIFEKDIKYNNTFRYHLYNKSCSIYCQEMNFFLNSMFLYTLLFEKSLNFLLKLNKSDNLLFKKNFYFLRKNLNEI